MKKVIAVIICFVLSMSLTGCEKVPVSESRKSSDFNNVIKWFDCLNGDEMVWDGTKEYNLYEFPGVTFRWDYGHLEAVTEEKTVTLYTGMPIWSVYFYADRGQQPVRRSRRPSAGEKSAGTRPLRWKTAPSYGCRGIFQKYLDSHQESG